VDMDMETKCALLPQLGNLASGLELKLHRLGLYDPAFAISSALQVCGGVVELRLNGVLRVLDIRALHLEVFDKHLVCLPGKQEGKASK
jgi:hypothetical protein